MNIPDFITVYTADKRKIFSAEESISFDDVSVSIITTGNSIKVRVTADNTPLEFIRLRWNRKFPQGAKFLGDAWERAYGDLQWLDCNASRMMPWYFLMNCNETTCGFGVKVRAGAMALWNTDSQGITLYLDLRCGTQGVLLANRTLDAAEIVSEEYNGISAFQAARSFCKLMCSDPLLPPAPVYGGNNWYYAYGKSSHEEILSDCRYIASLCEGLKNTPFMVIDDGWEILHLQPGNSGPWDKSNSKYPDMAQLAAEMRKCGVRPGIWFRPLWNLDPSIPQSWLMCERHHTGHMALDPSVPEVLELVKQDIRRFSDWGFELIKHDFSTWDIFGLWGKDIPFFPACNDDGNDTWSFSDRSRTSAEIVVGLYRAIHEAAGDTLILGCNTIGHLGAGLMQLARIGDDTSGKAWERTRKMGINCLAFRLCQHGTFFDVDADCLGVTGTINWQQNRQWAELLAKSGTPLFASIKPGILSEKEFADMKEFFALSAEQKIQAEPLDWLTSPAPEHWKFDDCEQRFSWYEDIGATPDFITIYS